MSRGDDIKQKLVNNAEPVDRFIQSILMSREPESLYEASRYLISAGGKRLRPYLVIKSCESVGGLAKYAIPFAASLEILHNFTLVHDDVMDNDELRRGKPTVHTKFGEPMAILAGDLLFAKVYQSVLDHAPAHMGSDEIVSALGKMTDSIILLCEGQALDISFPQAMDVTENDYLQMIGGKTSALFMACAEVGALAGGASKAQITALGSFAWDAGLAFQIIDDILGITADESKLGKPVGSDIREGKKTLIMIHALANADERQMQVLSKAVGVEGASKAGIDAVVKTLGEIGSIQYARDEAEKYTASAFESIKAIPEGPSKQDLVDLVNYFVQREY
ncbi:polyprenyl synthetase family protein [Candidatus Bathyarchaeota archaeon]|jgi:geranylgeranyl diphosphate synthase, type I|nr:polyprenyl synthetase family protein [Candidatus Bathyarchaeota archaeon]MBT4423382.1 polyprenyl synthetase family protein [Candidatus Bathyarchaeota archaeon]MBT5641664.1 polyprenyl synthetase family protein [Candidatus Bathyarchaeota archaeon]MBT6603958.1 polyprenyl synthetase family protein [Candidatus Bathyarchaeota archaeon]MBT7186287.1 polyprenyl synthetase family protein [Candidatus Bathyarchaeota archaeon]